eukprot:3836410-Rhodomonas_salina.1
MSVLLVPSDRDWMSVDRCVKRSVLADLLPGNAQRRNKLLLQCSGGFLLVVPPPSLHLFHVPASLEGSAQLELAELVQTGAVNLFAVPNLCTAACRLRHPPCSFSRIQALKSATRAMSGWILDHRYQPCCFLSTSVMRTSSPTFLSEQKATMRT